MLHIKKKKPKTHWKRKKIDQTMNKQFNIMSYKKNKINVSAAWTPASIDGFYTMHVDRLGRRYAATLHQPILTNHDADSGTHDSEHNTCAILLCYL